MNWKQFLHSPAARQLVRATHKRQHRGASRILASPYGPAHPGGRLIRQLASALDEPPEAVILDRYKQGMYSFHASGRYLRAACGRGGHRFIADEYAGWQRLRELGLGHAVSPRLEWLDLAGRWRALVDAAKQPIERDELPLALFELVPPLVERAALQSFALPATVSFGHAVLTSDRNLAELVRLPSLTTLSNVFRRPQRFGFFHTDLHIGNIMRLHGRFNLNDLKSCREGCVIDLELLRTILRYYPTYQDRSLLERLFMAAEDNWDQPAMAPLVALVRLPRELWLPLFLCHAVGTCHGLKKRPAVNLSNRIRGFFARHLLQQRLRAAVQSAPSVATGQPS